MIKTITINTTCEKCPYYIICTPIEESPRCSQCKHIESDEEFCLDCIGIAFTDICKFEPRR